MLPTTDTVGREYVDDSFKRALVSFAVARGLNGVISVAQGTEVAVQPAGMGVSFTPGEILDPINDLVERFSWIMLLATSSLGVQKVLLSMSAWQGLILLLLAVSVLLIASHVLFKNERVRAVLGRVFLFVLVLRFMMPAIAIANEWVYVTFLQDDYIAATAELETAQEEIRLLNDRSAAVAEPPEGIVDRALDLYNNVVDQIDLEKRFDEYAVAAETISENTVQLIVVFVMQTVVFPLLFLAVVFGIIRRLSRWY